MVYLESLNVGIVRSHIFGSGVVAVQRRFFLEIFKDSHKPVYAYVRCIRGHCSANGVCNNKGGNRWQQQEEAARKEMICSKATRQQQQQRRAAPHPLRQDCCRKRLMLSYFLSAFHCWLKSLGVVVTSSHNGLIIVLRLPGCGVRGSAATRAESRRTETVQEN